MAKIYLATSWRNELQPGLVRLLREFGHEVYDFRNPPKSTGFAWSELDPDWKNWTAAEYREALHKPRAIEGFNSDFDAMKWADTCLLVLPCGRSAHLELGWSVDAGKRTIILTRDGEEPELMAKMVTNICVTVPEVLAALGSYHVPGDPVPTWTDRSEPGDHSKRSIPETFDRYTPPSIVYRMDVDQAVDGWTSR